MFDDEDFKKMGIGKGYTFLSYVIIFGGILLVSVFVVAFVYDLFTGNLSTGGGSNCNPEYSVCDDGGYDGFGRR
jgi:hypothetical protein